MPAEELDRFDPALALGVEGTLREFNEAGVLATSDVHVAERLTALSGVTDDLVRLGVAFAARAPRLGHVCVDLAAIRLTANSESDADDDIDALPWPDPGAWRAAMSSSPLVGDERPLHLAGANLYLNRLWTDEVQVTSDLLELASTPAPGVDEAQLSKGLAEMFPAGSDDDPAHLQTLAAAVAVLRRVSVIAGGPGTGKTTTVARVLALLEEQATAAGRRPPLVALAAPTGKAAARLEEAVRAGAADMGLDDDDIRQRLQGLRGTTLHRLLGFNPGNRTRFRHDRSNPLRHDVVVVDETSMVALSMMARLLESIRSDARLILVGDPEQLASVEAGAVLGDIVGPASTGLCMGSAARARLEAVTRYPVPEDPGGRHSAIGDGVVSLRHVHRHRGGIAALARAIQRGDVDAAMAVLEEGDSNVEWIPAEAAQSAAGDVGAIRALAVRSGREAIEAAKSGDARGALEALGGFRLLCAHRRGPEGVTTWTQLIEGWLLSEVEDFSLGGDWYVGRPLIVTENDHALQLFNGDIGVVVKGRDRPMEAAFERGGEVVRVSPTRLAAVDTVYAMTVHKSQGSQFRVVAFVLPAPGSRILTRELLYTAVTRAQERLVLVGTEESIRSAIARPIARASGLRRALWGERGESTAT
jgi:exodeoxyribonuclease V alpha subunit